MGLNGDDRRYSIGEMGVINILKDHPVAAGGLGVVEGMIGELDQAGRIPIHPGRQAGDAQTDGDIKGGIRSCVGNFQIVNGRPDPLGDKACPHGIGFRQQDGKFLAPIARAAMSAAR